MFASGERIVTIKHIIRYYNKAEDRSIIYYKIEKKLGEVPAPSPKLVRKKDGSVSLAKEVLIGPVTLGVFLGLGLGVARAGGLPCYNVSFGLKQHVFE